MRFVEVVLTTVILVAATASTLARDDLPQGFAAHGPAGAARQPSQIAGEASAVKSTAPAVLRSTPAPPRLALEPAGRRPREAPKRTRDWFDWKRNRSISTMVGSLAVVLGVFLLFAWAVRKRLPKGSARLPEEIIEVLGRTTLAAKQSLHLVRIGGKLIVVSVTASGTETVTEITDPGEVARILAACQQRHVHSSTTAFRQVFDQVAREPASGFLGKETGRSPFGREGTGVA